MKKQRLVIVVLVVITVLMACSKMQMTPSDAGHPQLSEQEMLIACSECHKKTTPPVYNEWYASTHGIGSVKCYQCHGTYENLQKTPDMTQSCGSCHADKLGDHSGTQTCWECHDVHSFSAN